MTARIEMPEQGKGGSLCHRWKSRSAKKADHDGKGGNRRAWKGGS